MSFNAYHILQISIMTGITLFQLQSETPSILHASTVCIHPVEREGGSGLCRHIKAAAVRFGNTPCRTSLFTATPSRMLKQSAVVPSLCFISTVAKYSCFGEFCFIQAVKYGKYSMCIHKWEVLLKKDNCYCSIAAYYGSCTYYFELCLLL